MYPDDYWLQILIETISFYPVRWETWLKNNFNLHYYNLYMLNLINTILKFKNKSSEKTIPSHLSRKQILQEKIDFIQKHSKWTDDTQALII